MIEPTGPDRIRQAIERDRGGHAPTQAEMAALTGCCSTPDPHAMRADDPRWPGNQPPPEPHRRITERAIEALICPGCLSLRFGPGHLTRKLAGIDCRHA